tara:strand:+ start:2350 stop:3249 length:900 start_codon:yes stop_codon:yes gene_type:complete
MRILVTGGAGFLGSHLVDALVARGDDVVVFDDLSRGDKSQVDERAKLVTGDVRNQEDWEEACRDFQPDVIHHLAAINGTRRFHNEADLVVDVNVNGTRMALEYAKKLDSRIVFYSSPEAFGEQEKMPLNNNSTSVFTPAFLHQRHSYGASKHIGELLCHFEARKGMDVRIARPFNVYGPRLHGGENGQVVSMMMTGNTIQVHGTGLQTRSFTWVGDIVEALLKIGDLDHISGHSFNLGSLEELSILSLAKKIAKHRGVEIVHIESNHGDSQRRLPDVSMNSVIDWSAETSLEEGLSQLL